jgi:predicted nucleotide-binding protein
MVFLGNRERSRAFADSATQQASHAGQRAEISSTAARLTITLGNRERSRAFVVSATLQVARARCLTLLSYADWSNETVAAPSDQKLPFCATTLYKTMESEHFVSFLFFPLNYYYGARQH